MNVCQHELTTNLMKFGSDTAHVQHPGTSSAEVQ